MTLPEIRKLLGFKPFVMPGDAACILGISNGRVWQLINEGKLETFVFLGSRRVVSASIMARIRSLQSQPNRRVKSRAVSSPRCRRSTPP